MVPLRRLATVVNGGTPTADSSNWGGEVPWATPVDLGRHDGRTIRATERTLTDRGLETGSSLVPERSIILSTRAPIGYVCVNEVAMAFNQGCRGLIPRANGSPEYLRYALLHLRPHLQAAGTGSTFMELSSGSLASMPVPVVGDRVQQDAVVAFLDLETAKIDALIAKQDALASSLHEERTGRRDALIGEAWTGGERVQLRYLGEMTVGIVVTPSAWYADSGVPALRGLNVKDEKIDSAELVHLTDEGHAAHPKSHLREGDVVVVRTGQAGTAAAIPGGLGELNAIDLLIARPGPNLDGDYLAMVLNGSRTESAIMSGTVGAIQGHFNVGALRQVEVPLPSLRQQRDLVREWRATASRIDMMLSRGWALRDVLVERRAALITAAVTGTLDVTTYGKAG